MNLNKKHMSKKEQEEMRRRVREYIFYSHDNNNNNVNVFKSKRNKLLLNSYVILQHHLKAQIKQLKHSLKAVQSTRQQKVIVIK